MLFTMWYSTMLMKWPIKHDSTWSASYGYHLKFIIIIVILLVYVGGGDSWCACRPDCEASSVLSSLYGFHRWNSDCPAFVAGHLANWLIRTLHTSFVKFSVPVLWCFDYKSFIVAFEVRKHDASSNFVLFTWDGFGYLGVSVMPFEF